MEKEAQKKEKNTKKESHKKENTQNIELENLKKENQELNDKLLRVMAEMQNMKRRNDEERARLIQYDGEDLIKKLLPVIDNFERAISLDDANLADDLSKFLEGFKLIYGNVLNILKEKNIEEIPCVGESFDPTKMEAVLTDKIDDLESGTVIDCLQKGYTYNGKVVRVAMVKVNE